MSTQPGTALTFPRHAVNYVTQQELEVLAEAEEILSLAIIKRNRTLLAVLTRIEAGAPIEIGDLSFDESRLATVVSARKRMAG